MAKRLGIHVAAAVASISLSLFINTPVLALDKPAGASATAVKKPAQIDQKTLALLKPSVDALVKEAKEGMKDGKNTGLREKSDYFGETNKLPEAVTPDVLLAALDQQQSSIPPIDAYVKWQLLSGLPQELNEDQLAHLYAIYKKAPEPLPNPGLRRTELQTALYRVGAMNPKNDVVINKDFDAALDQWNAYNTYIIEYRNALYLRFKPGYATLMAGTEDLFTRVQKGLEVKTFWERIETSARTWSATAEPAQLNTMVGAFTKLKAINSDPRFKPYTHVIQNPDKNKMGLTWDERQEINDQYLTGLINDLKDASRPGPAGPAVATPAKK